MLLRKTDRAGFATFEEGVPLSPLTKVGGLHDNHETGRFNIDDGETKLTPIQAVLLNCTSHQESTTSNEHGSYLSAYSIPLKWSIKA